MKNQTNQQRQKKLSEIAPNELSELKTVELERLCKDEDLATDGKREDLLKRLITRKAEQQVPKKMSEITLGELNEMKVIKLKQLCKDEGISTKGKKKELLKWLEIKKTGISDRYVGQLTRCKICGNTIRVITTGTQIQDDGRTLVTRTVRCQGKHKHTYPLKDIV